MAEMPNIVVTRRNISRCQLKNIDKTSKNVVAQRINNSIGIGFLRRPPLPVLSTEVGAVEQVHSLLLSEYDE